LKALVIHGRTPDEVAAIMAAVNEGDALAVALYRNGECPECKGHEFHPGPFGGLSENIRCAQCGAKFWIGAPFDPKPVSNSDVVFDLSRRFDLREYFTPDPPRGASRVS